VGCALHISLLDIYNEPGLVVMLSRMMDGVDPTAPDPLANPNRLSTPYGSSPSAQPGTTDLGLQRSEPPVGFAVWNSDTGGTGGSAPSDERRPLV